MQVKLSQLVKTTFRFIDARLGELEQTFQQIKVVCDIVKATLTALGAEFQDDVTAGGSRAVLTPEEALIFRYFQEKQ